MEEQELAERCRQGDNLARKELYERYAGRMLSVCLRYAGDRETAQDLMHDGCSAYVCVMPVTGDCAGFDARRFPEALRLFR